jgi:hypothetical protein
MKVVGNIPRVPGSFAGVDGWMTLDTGANNSLTVVRSFVEKNGLEAKYPNRKSAVVGKGVGGFVQGDFVKLDSFKLAGIELTNVPASFSKQTSGAFASGDIIGNVGASVLEKFLFTFDYPNKKAYFERSPKYDAPYEVDRAGMFLDFEGKKFKVASIVKGSASDLAGIKVGDEVVEINGVEASKLVALEVGKTFRQPAGSKVKLKVRRGTETAQDVVVVLQDILP